MNVVTAEIYRYIVGEGGSCGGDATANFRRNATIRQAPPVAEKEHAWGIDPCSCSVLDEIQDLQLKVLYDHDNDDDDDDDEPSLAAVSNSDSSLSLPEEEDDSLTSSPFHSRPSSPTGQTEGQISASNKDNAPRRSVSFGTVETRHYALCVGDHPFCYDGLALTLDWASSKTHVEDLSCHAPQRRTKYRLPRKLSYEERRFRLRTVSAYSEERVKTEELDVVIQMLQESWLQPSRSNLLPGPTFDNLEEDDDDNRDDEVCEATIVAVEDDEAAVELQDVNLQEIVIQWKRMGLRRSNSFSE